MVGSHPLLAAAAAIRNRAAGSCVPDQVFALGLLVIGCLNIAFGLSSSVALFGLLWGLNGVFQ
eukprot:gene8675-10294_t